MRKREPRYFLLLLLVSSTMLFPIRALSPLKVTVTTNKSNYVSMDLVDINGNLTYSDDPAQGLVGIQVGPYGKLPVVMRTLSTGNISSMGWDIEIVSVQPCDQDGNPKQNFERGKWSYFKTIVKNNEIFDNNLSIAINAYDSTLIPLGLARTQVTVKGESMVTFGPAGVWIPEWATVGNAPVYVSVYTDWLENGGRPYCPEEMGDFAIVKSMYEEPPDNPLPEETVQNGSYSVQFCLGPEPANGTHKVRACAYYLGYTTSDSHNFLVNPEDVTNLAVVNIAPDAVYNNWVPEIRVTVKNMGTLLLESFNVSIYIDAAVIGFETVTSLEKNQQETLTLLWNTTGSTPLSTFAVRANATILPDEIYTTDNELTDNVTIKLLGDVVFDRTIDISDVVSITGIYGSEKGDSNWNREVDLMLDGVIDISDVVVATSIYGTTY